MKYRRLTIEELEELQPEFTTFLATHGIPAEDWVKMKGENPERCERLIEMFSDIVFDKILAGVEFLEHREAKIIRIFKFEKSKVIMNGLKIDGDTSIDFRKDQNSEQMNQLFRLSSGKLNIFTAQKEYKQDRSLEIFRLMQSGARILKEDRLFRTIEELKNQNQ